MYLQALRVRGMAFGDKRASCQVTLEEVAQRQEHAGSLGQKRHMLS